jgi:hypothetical protein
MEGRMYQNGDKFDDRFYTTKHVREKKQQRQRKSVVHISKIKLALSALHLKVN